MDGLVGRPGVALLVVALTAGSPVGVVGQGLSYSLMLGFGRTSWTGPFVQSGRWGSPVAAVGGELRPIQSIGIRAELGLATREADLGRSGFFAEETTLTHYRAQLGAVGRFYPVRQARSTRFFGEVGLIGWIRTGCDVDMVGGPGFLGGETLDCDDFEPDGTGAANPFAPSRSGATLLVGAGARRGAWGAMIRYEAGGALLDTSSGPIKAKALLLTFEWVFRGLERQPAR